MALGNFLYNFLCNVPIPAKRMSGRELNISDIGFLPVWAHIRGIQLHVVIAADKCQLHCRRLELEGFHFDFHLFDTRTINLQR
jgi:hypothetical protein